MDLDSEIKEKAESWEQEHHKTEREKARLKHQRWTAVGRFFKTAFIGLTALALAGGAIFGVNEWALSCAAQEQRAHAQTKQLKLLYEQTWIDCLDKLGREQCEIIQETGLYECVSGQAVSTSCVTDRIEERAASLETN